NGNYNWRWFSERDKMSVFATGNVVGLNNGTAPSADWSGNPLYATYKATRSESKGLFTAATDDDALDFGTNKDANGNYLPGEFLIMYPNTVVVSSSTVKDGALNAIGLGNLPSLTGQDMSVMANEPSTRLTRYQLTKAEKGERYETIADKVEVKLASLNTMARFSTANLSTYANGSESLFGKLLSIRLDTKGAKDDKGLYITGKVGDDDVKLSSSYIDYGTGATAVIDFTDNTRLKNVITPSESADTLISVGINSYWDDSKSAFMAMSLVDRANFRALGKKESYDVTFTFENIALKFKTRETANSWPSSEATQGAIDPGKFVDFVPFDINEFPYLVVGKAPNLALIINTGDLGQAFSADKASIKWDAAKKDVNGALADGLYPVELFKNIIINPNLADTEYSTYSNLFTNLVSATLVEETHLPKDAFKLASLKEIVAKKVVTIEDGAFTGAELDTVILPSYPFTASDQGTGKILNPGSLRILDMSAVMSMAINWPSQGYTLAGYTNLEEVTVQDEITLGTSSFDGCTALKKVNGAVELTGANVFKGCAQLESIALTTPVIMGSAFEGCGALSKVTDKEGKAIVPTFVGEKAFNNCVNIVEMDLSAVVHLGKNAFLGATSFYGVEDKSYTPSRKIMKVGAAHIPEGAFANTAIEHAYFMNAISFDSVILHRTASLKQVRFDQIFDTTLDVTYGATTFGPTPGNVMLFVNDAQTGYIGNILTIGKTPVNFSFAGINKVSTINE
ncbi:leucine-rich repeat domain-containing protein, partial [Bacteroides sp. OttesenSCG-928-E20]|nr:leucine-rich repeat domain-containing protein [Bacteroides sp. OttesenSCG-928-E20]